VLDASATGLGLYLESVRLTQWLYFRWCSVLWIFRITNSQTIISKEKIGIFKKKCCAKWI